MINLKGKNTLLKEEYLSMRYNLDQVLPDATIEVHRGRFTEKPYERMSIRVEYLDQREWYN